MEEKKYGIALLFNQMTTNEAIRLSKNFLSKAGDKPLELGLETEIPHLTLFMLMLDEKSVEGVKVAIQEVLDETITPKRERSFRRGNRSLYGRFSQLRAMGKALYWAQSSKENPILKRFHEDIVKATVPHACSRVPLLREARGVNLANWETYGYPLVMKRFHPHATLQWLAEEYTGEKFETKPWKWMSRKLVLTEMNHRGVITSNQHAASFRLG